MVLSMLHLMLLTPSGVVGWLFRGLRGSGGVRLAACACWSPLHSTGQALQLVVFTMYASHVGSAQFSQGKGYCMPHMSSIVLVSL